MLTGKLLEVTEPLYAVDDRVVALAVRVYHRVVYATPEGIAVIYSEIEKLHLQKIQSDLEILTVKRVHLFNETITTSEGSQRLMLHTGFVYTMDDGYVYFEEALRYVD